MRSQAFHMFQLHLLCLVDAGDGWHLAVFVGPKYLAHGARGHPVGDAVNVDLFVLVCVAHRHLFLPLLNWFAAVEGSDTGGKARLPCYRGCTSGCISMRPANVSLKMSQWPDPSAAPRHAHSPLTVFAPDYLIHCSSFRSLFFHPTTPQELDAEVPSVKRGYLMSRRPPPRSLSQLLVLGGSSADRCLRPKSSSTPSVWLTAAPPAFYPQGTSSYTPSQGLKFLNSTCSLTYWIPVWTCRWCSQPVGSSEGRTRRACPEPPRVCRTGIWSGRQMSASRPSLEGMDWRPVTFTRHAAKHYLCRVINLRKRLYY